MSQGETGQAFHRARARGSSDRYPGLLLNSQTRPPKPAPCAVPGSDLKYRPPDNPGQASAADRLGLRARLVTNNIAESSFGKLDRPIPRRLAESLSVCFLA